MTKSDAKEWARRYVGRRPFLFYNFYRLKPSYRDLLVDRRTRIVIEGFPRSGNTFAVAAFEQAQREMERVNAKFGTGFTSFVHSEDNVK